MEELEQFARDPIVLSDDVSPLDGFQFLTGFSRPSLLPLSLCPFHSTAVHAHVYTHAPCAREYTPPGAANTHREQCARMPCDIGGRVILGRHSRSARYLEGQSVGLGVPSYLCQQCATHTPVHACLHVPARARMCGRLRASRALKTSSNLTHEFKNSCLLRAKRKSSFRNSCKPCVPQGVLIWKQ